MPFHDLTGHVRTIRSLQTALSRGVIASAYLFCGPDGIGKKTVALGLAKAVNCRSYEDDFCDRCDSCRRIENRVHPDFFFLEPDGQSIKIDQLRDLMASIGYKPFMAKRKICIIDQAERMTGAASNAILKTLEEPPGEMVIMLITGHAEQILPTIRSRCQVLKFFSLSASELRRLITEKMGGMTDKINLLTALAGGSFGRIKNLDLNDLQEKRKIIFRLMEYISTQNRPGLLAEAKRLTAEKNPDDLFAWLELWMGWYYDLWRYKITNSEEHLINVDQIDYINQQASQFSRPQIQGHILYLQDAYKALKRNANKQLTIEVMLMKLSTNVLTIKG